MHVEKTVSAQTIFPHRYCVNLDRRPERWLAARAQFQENGLAPVTRFSAVDGSHVAVPENWRHCPGGYGCLRSHLEIVRLARDRGYPSVFIFEDDVVFAPNFEAGMASALAELPADWDMLTLGGIHVQPPSPVSPHLRRTRGTLSTHAYVLNHSLYDAFIAHNERLLNPVDVTNTHLQQAFVCYLTMPHLAWQADGWSDIQQERESNWVIAESVVAVGREVERLEAETALVLAFDPPGSRLHSVGLANMAHVLHFYHARCPRLQITVVAAEGLLRPDAVPPFARLQTVPEQGLNPHLDRRDQLFRHGFERSDRELFIFSDGAVRPSKDRHIPSNLTMGARFDGATFFDEVIKLDAADSDLFRQGREREVDLERYHGHAKEAPGQGAFILSRKAMVCKNGRAVSDLEELRLFRSPNRGVLLQ